MGDSSITDKENMTDIGLLLAARFWFVWFLVLKGW